MEDEHNPDVYNPIILNSTRKEPHSSTQDANEFYEINLDGGKNKTKRNKKKQNKRTSIICYKEYGANKTGKHTVKQLRKTMRKHHVYDCLDKLCMKTKDKKGCKLSRKCNRRNNKKMFHYKKVCKVIWSSLWKM